MSPVSARVGLASTLAVIVLAGALSSPSVSAHNADECRGWARLDPVAATEFSYSAQSRCGTGWDTIAAGAILVRDNSSSFVLDSILEVDVDFTDDDAGVTGSVDLTAERCYINVGGHSAFEVHFSAGHVSQWIAFSISPYRCA